MNTRLLPLAAVLAVAAGCSIELQHNLSEQDANDIYVLLNENGMNTAATFCDTRFWSTVFITSGD